MCVVTANTTVTIDQLLNTTEWLTDFTDIVSKFSLRTADTPDDDMCYIVPGRPETIKECNFNPETQTFIVIHGWTVCHTEHTWQPCFALCKWQKYFVLMLKNQTYQLYYYFWGRIVNLIQSYTCKRKQAGKGMIGSPCIFCFHVIYGQSGSKIWTWWCFGCSPTTGHRARAKARINHAILQLSSH